MTDDQIRLLAEKWLKGTITDEEKVIFNDWYRQEYGESANWNSDRSRETLKNRLFYDILQKITGEKDAAIEAPVRSIGARRWYRYAAAAVLLFTIAGSYFIFKNTADQPVPGTAAAVRDIPPGSDKAILTLADGKQIVLTDTGNGAIASQGNVSIIKADGLVSYSSKGNAGEVVYNTITTPRTGQYQLVLSDGSKVWLDAESSIRFPNVFKGSERRVELTGQGYFEVAHNSKMPFHVVVGDMDVQVLGTHFNIMAYDNEDAVKTTLLEGSVKVSTTNGQSQTVILQPGSQAQFSKGKGLKRIAHADVDQAVAWKNGLFQLQGTSVREILRQIERWYDVDVVVQGNFRDEELSGVFSRKQYVSQLLKILEEAGVGRFTIEARPDDPVGRGRKIYVTNQ